MNTLAEPEMTENIKTWAEAEHRAAEHMRLLGFLDAAVTASGADGGLDVVSNDAVAQVKFHTVPTGSPDVQRLRGAAYGLNNVIFYSASGYTAAAKVYADSADVALFSIGPWNSIHPENDLAESLLPGAADRLAVAMKQKIAKDVFERPLLEHRYRQILLWNYVTGLPVEDARKIDSGSLDLIIELYETYERKKKNEEATRKASPAATLAERKGALAEIDDDLKLLVLIPGIDFNSFELPWEFASEGIDADCQPDDSESGLSHSRNENDY